MGTLKAVTVALALCLARTEARACDSYADEASLASVLARAVAEARANGSLEAQAGHRLLPAEAAPAWEPAGTPTAASEAGAGELGFDQRGTAAPAPPSAPASFSL
jgi:hypothetical protein